jgi:hypothetical protein
MFHLETCGEGNIVVLDCRIAVALSRHNEGLTVTDAAS